MEEAIRQFGVARVTEPPPGGKRWLSTAFGQSGKVLKINGNEFSRLIGQALGAVRNPTTDSRFRADVCEQLMAMDDHRRRSCAAPRFPP